MADCTDAFMTLAAVAACRSFFELQQLLLYFSEEFAHPTNVSVTFAVVA
jgi:hypothetical protein